jgi:hypothetical protein
MYLKRGCRLAEVVRRIQNATFTKPVRADTSIRGPTTPTNALSRVQAKDRDGVPGSGEEERGGLCVVSAKPIAHPKAHQELDEKVFCLSWKWRKAFVR